MIQDVKFSSEFCRAFKRLKKRYKSLNEDFKQLFLSLYTEPRQGVDLQNGMRKVRIAFSSKGKGKRGGGRVIIRLTVSDTCLSFLYIYDKSDMSNAADAFLDQIIIDMNSGNYSRGL